MRKFSFTYKLQHTSVVNSVKFNLKKDGSKSFKQGKFEVVELKDEYASLFNNSDVKYNLSDIDKITNQYDNAYALLKELHEYQPLYENLISYTINGRLRFLKPIYGRECFNELLNGNEVKDDYVDTLRAKKMLNELCLDDNFRRKFLTIEYYKSNDLETDIRELSACIKADKEDPSLEVSEAYNELRNKLENEFRKYHFYREALRCFDDYKKEKEEKEEKERLENEKNNFKEEIQPPKPSRPKYPDNIEGQVFLDGFGKSK